MDVAKVTQGLVSQVNNSLTIIVGKPIASLNKQFFDIKLLVGYILGCILLSFRSKVFTAYTFSFTKPTPSEFRLQELLMLLHQLH